jgi:hypothetical protein
MRCGEANITLTSALNEESICQLSEGGNLVLSCPLLFFWLAFDPARVDSPPEFTHNSYIYRYFSSILEDPARLRGTAKRLIDRLEYT